MTGENETPVTDVTVAIVSYNTRELLRDCLESVQASSGVNLRICVVDNASTDGTVEMVRAEFPCVELFASRRNLGFAAATNLMIRRHNSRYVLLLNPDTQVPRHTIGALADFMEAHPDVGICGPKIVRPDGTVQSCGEKFPTLLTELRQSKSLRWILAPFRHQSTNSKGDETSLHTDTEWVSGACLMARRELIDDIGPLDEQFFLYAEELDWCYRAKRARWHIAALPSVASIHHQGKSTEQVRERALAYFWETRLRYYRKNRGLYYAALVSLVYVAGAANEWRSDRRKASVRLKATGAWWRTLWSEPGR
jgi:GT2 family glycosyltransferase